MYKRQGLNATDACTGTARCSPISPSTAAAHDRNVVLEGETLPLGAIGGSKVGSDISPTQEDDGLAARAILDDTGPGPIEEPIMTRAVPPCAWCGALVDAKNGVSVHTAEFCDQDSEAPDAR